MNSHYLNHQKRDFDLAQGDREIQKQWEREMTHFSVFLHPLRFHANLSLIINYADILKYGLCCGFMKHSNQKVFIYQEELPPKSNLVAHDILSQDTKNHK